MNKKFVLFAYNKSDEELQRLSDELFDYASKNGLMILKEVLP